MERSLTILENTPLAPGVFRLLLDGAEADDVRAPGQFFNLSLDGFYLRRPISVCDAAGSRVTLIYKVVGAGTRALSDYRPGRTLRVLTALGNGYDLTETGSHPLLLGGGAGVPPMYLLAKALLARGVRPTVVLGFNTASEVFYKTEFESLGVPTVVATADGSAGVPGFVTDALRRACAYDYTFACGPEPMLQAVCAMSGCGGQFSLRASGWAAASAPAWAAPARHNHGQQAHLQRRSGARRRRRFYGRPLGDAAPALSWTTPSSPPRGTFGYGKEFAALLRHQHPRARSPSRVRPCTRASATQRRASRRRRRGMLNAVGLQNPGMDACASAHELPELRQHLSQAGHRQRRRLFCRRICRNARVKAASAGNEVGWIEMNISCPNVHGGGHGLRHHRGKRRRR